MKKKNLTLLSYNSKKTTNYLQNQQCPLSSKKPFLTDINISSSNNKPLTTRQSYSKKNNNSIDTKKLKINKKLLFVFKDPKEKYKKKLVWPKITHAKLPFSERHQLSEEERKQKIMQKKTKSTFS